MTKTKLIATIGPSSNTKTVLKSMASAGMTIARFNFSHGTYDWYADVFETLRYLNGELDKPVSLMLDTAGPEVRTQPDFAGIDLKRGKTYVIGHTKSCDIAVTYRRMKQVCKKGLKLQLDGGLGQLEVLGSVKQGVLVKSLSTMHLGPRKHVNIPGAKLGLPILSEKDKEDIAFGIKHGIHMIAVSFVSDAKDIQTVRRFVKTYTDEPLPIIAKVENAAALDSLDEIFKEAEGVMIARGDLAVETSFEKVPALQRKLVRMSAEYGKPIIMATHMLRSMTEDLLPTRAEITDVANAVYLGVDAVMLSEESSVGAHPARCVRTMRKICQATEADMRKEASLPMVTSHCSLVTTQPQGGVLEKGVQLAEETKGAALAIVTDETSVIGSCARLRPKAPLFVLTSSRIVAGFANLLYGTEVVKLDRRTMKKLRKAPDTIATFLRRKKVLSTKNPLVTFHHAEGSKEVDGTLIIKK